MTDPRAVDQFAATLAALELRVAAADAGGDPVPEEAREMLSRLREITDALHALTSSIQGLELPPAGPAPDRASDRAGDTPAVDETPGDASG